MRNSNMAIYNTNHDKYTLLANTVRSKKQYIQSIRKFDILMANNFLYYGSVNTYHALSFLSKTRSLKVDLCWLLQDCTIYAAIQNFINRLPLPFTCLFLQKQTTVVYGTSVSVKNFWFKTLGFCSMLSLYVWCIFIYY